MARKDWKRKTFNDGSYYYVNKKRKGTLHIGERSVGIQIGRVKHRGVELTQTHIYEEFKSRKQAEKFARCFMRTENREKCLGGK